MKKYIIAGKRLHLKGLIKRCTAWVLVFVVLVSSCIDSIILNAEAAWEWGPDQFIYPMDDLHKKDDLKPSWAFEGGLNVFKDTGYDYVPDCEVNLYHSGWTGTDECEVILSQCYQTFLAWGMCREGAVAVCGNIANESGGDPTAFGGGFSVKWEDERVLDSSKSKCLGFRTMGQGGEGVDFGMGLIEFTANVWIIPVFYIAAHEGKEWTDLGCQLLCLSYDFGPRCQSETVDPKTSKQFKPFYDESDNARSLIGLGGWGNYTGDTGDYMGDLNADGANGKIARCTLSYMANCEVPAVGLSHADRRIESAQRFYKEWEDLEPCDYSNGGTSSRKKKSDAKTSGVGAVVNQWQLEGMPKRSGLVRKIYTPSEPDRENLNISELYNLSQISSNIKESREFMIWDTIRVLIVFLGMVLMVYTMLLVLAMLIDIWNNFFDFSLVHIITFGKVKYTKDPEAFLQSHEYTSTKKLVVAVIVMFVLSCVIISGGVVPVIFRMLYKVHGLFAV